MSCAAKWSLADGDDGAEMWRNDEGEYILHADHAQIVAAKDEEIRRLREALEGVLSRSETARPFLMAGLEMSVTAGYRDVGQRFLDALDAARAALDPPQQKEGQ